MYLTVELSQYYLFQFQSNFTRSFSNLLNTEATAVRESQESFQAASGILDTLAEFGRRAEFENTALNLQENNLQLQIEDVESNRLQDFQPDLTNTSALEAIQDNPMEKPLQGADISLPSDLLAAANSTETIRVLNVLLQNDVLFVTEPLEDDEQSMTGNLIITAGLYDREDDGGSESQSVVIDNLPESQAVLIRFNVTEVYNT